MRLNRKVEYALLALKHLSLQGENGFSSSREISGSNGIPFDMMAQVLRSLARGGVLKSDQGARGGYSLAKNLEMVSLYDIHKIILGPLYLAHCLNPEPTKSCDLISSCSIQKPVDRLNRRFQIFLRSISASELVSDDYEITSADKTPLVSEVEGVS